MLTDTTDSNVVKKPVLVVGSIPRIVTTIARSLHGHGVPVDVLDLSFDPRIHSRAIREFIRLPYPEPFPGLPPAEFIGRLRDFIKRQGHDMLIPTSDQALACVGRYYNDLADLLYIACPPPEILRLILNKACTLEIAQGCGIQVPKTFAISNKAQVQELIDIVGLPAVLKPAGKTALREEFKSYLLTHADEVPDMFPRPSDSVPSVMLQEFCLGVGVGVEVLMHKGEGLAVFQHRRLKEFPYTGGFAVTAIAEELDPALVQSSFALLRALRWEGIAMVEFRVNPQNGRAVLMEVNGRYWGSISLPIFAGMDFPLYQWQVVHGEVPSVPATYSVGTRWRWTNGYMGRIHWLAIAATRSGDARRTLFRDMKGLPADFAPSVCDSLFEASDPMPAAFEIMGFAKSLLSHDLRELFKRVRGRRQSS
jgi:predicted ATP-grasp superfamily ATP-dependent carboligase